LLLGTTLEFNYPEKQIRMVLEEEPDGLDFLAGYEKVKSEPLIKALEESKPDLFIIVDSNSYDRVSRHDGQRVKNFLETNAVKTAIIDHHEPEDKDQTEVYLNSGRSAAVQEVYEICFEQLNLKKPTGYAGTTMTGLYSDTGGFAYLKPDAKKTFLLAAELLETGASVERIKNRLNQYSEDQIKVLGELMANLSHADDYTYSYISDDFMDNWIKSRKSIPAMHSARKRFIDEYIRNIDGRQWGFVISLDPQEDGRVYSLSLRSVGDAKDVSAIARKFDGGGHKPAAGGKVEAENVEEAIKKVQLVISQSK
jgi:phosphoesterase RecJ-like protein